MGSLSPSGLNLILDHIVDLSPVVPKSFIDGIFIYVPSYLVIESALRGVTLASNYVF